MKNKKEKLIAPTAPPKTIDSFTQNKILLKSKFDYYNNKINFKKLTEKIPPDADLKDVEIILSTGGYSGGSSWQLVFKELNETPEYFAWLEDKKKYDKDLAKYNLALKQIEISKLEAKLETLKKETVNVG